MHNDEFVRLHGQEAWDQLVRPKKDTTTNVIAQNANILTHLEITPILKLIGFTGESILEAQQELEKLRAKICL